MAEQDKDQRTEQPTAQRIRKAFEEGQIGTSNELLGSISFATGVVFFLLAGVWFFSIIARTIKMREAVLETAPFDASIVKQLIVHDVKSLGVAIVAMLVPIVFVTILVGGMQTNFNISFKPLELKWDKMSVKKGFGRIFSTRSLMRGFMAVLKASAIVAIVYLIATTQFSFIATAGNSTAQMMVFRIGQILLYLSIAAALTITLIGLGDLAFQKWKHLQDLRMSIRDIRDEHKESEGDPLIRARVKRLQNEMSRQRMVQQVARSSVVITNPTHFAVAVEYDKSTMVAPKVAAKGKEHLAKKIIEIAKEHGVPVVERKPVARFLYFNVKIGQSIPQELYEAVAEILNFIRKMNMDKRSA